MYGETNQDIVYGVLDLATIVFSMVNYELAALL